MCSNRKSLISSEPNHQVLRIQMPIVPKATMKLGEASRLLLCQTLHSGLLHGSSCRGNRPLVLLESSILGQGGRAFELPRRDPALVELIKLPVCAAKGLLILSEGVQLEEQKVTYFGIVEVEKNRCGNQDAGPHVDRLDAEVRSVGADHV